MNLSLALVSLVLATALDTTIAPHLSLIGIRPDLVLLIVVATSIVRGGEEGIVWGILGGFLLDLYSGVPFGLSIVALAITAYLTKVGEDNLFSHVLVLPLAAAFVGTVVYDLILMAGLQAAGRPIDWGEGLLHVVVPSAFLNAILMPVVYVIVRQLHHWVHRPVRVKM